MPRSSEKDLRVLAVSFVSSFGLRENVSAGGWAVLAKILSGAIS